ncbi:MAG: T9SS type A sorting domain-containing protein [Bacteroidota bacterium]|nr:T9SS type A sorting domain-containing protein [Bacteroidota bacterium]
MKTNHFIFLFLLLVIGSRINSQTYAVGHQQITYNDPARAGRAIQTEIYYPAATAGTGVPVSAGTFPLIVFGHGFVMTWDAYQNVWDDLVPRGYIIAFPRTEGNFSPNHGEFGKDLAFLVGKMQNESATNSASLFFNHINSKSAIMGHSMGGGSSFLAAENNTLITTMISFAAANTTPSSITAAQNISVPSLVFAGANDCVAPPAAHQIPMYDSLVSACKAYVSITGGAHCEFANYNFNCSFGQSTCTPTPAITGAEQKDAMSDLLNLWLSYYLKEDCAAWTSFNDSLAVSPRITSSASCNISNPVITQAGMVLSSTAAPTYQWYLNGSLISGATAQNLTVIGPGVYHVETTWYNDCPYLSNMITVTSTGTEEAKLYSLKLYPNPVKDQLSLEWNSSFERVTIRLTDLSGRVVKVVKEMQGNGVQVIDLSELEAGIYFVELSAENFKSTERIIKLK